MDNPFLALMVLALGGALLVWAFQRIKLSPLLGYLALGILLAPIKHDLFSDETLPATIAEVGVILLMFFIGLEFRLDQIRRMLGVCLVGGTLQVAVTGGVSALVARALGAGWAPSLVIGISIAFSSTALVMRVYEERGETDGHHARVALAVLLYQDLAAVAAIAVIPLLAAAGNGMEQMSALKMAQKYGSLVVLLPALFFGVRAVLPWLFERVAAARMPELLTLVSLGACFAVAVAAMRAGASPALGAFVGGLVLSGSPMAAQVRAELNTIRQLSLAFFFVTIGMLLNLQMVLADPFRLFAALGALIAVKAVLAAVSLLATRTPVRLSAGVGVALAQIGEFSFVVNKEALGLKLLDQPAHDFLLALAVLSMVLTPFLVTAGDRLLRFHRRAARHSEPVKPVEGESAIVVGYGPVGRTLAAIFKDFGVRPVVVDLNLATVRSLRKEGMAAVYGDARRREVLDAAGILNAASVVVTLPDLDGRLGVVAQARRANPGAQILVRARFLQELPLLEEAGATAVRCEECEVAAALAELLLRRRGAPQPWIEEATEKIRVRFRGESSPAAPSTEAPAPKEKGA